MEGILKKMIFSINEIVISNKFVTFFVVKIARHGYKTNVSKTNHETTTISSRYGLNRHFFELFK